MKLVSIVIRTLNEARYLPELLEAIKNQVRKSFDIEVVVVDSGSSDMTIRIAEEFGCRITTISKKLFTFGRSLNVGSEFAKGDILVYVSGHCIPTNEEWLKNLINPLILGKAGYTYGRQIGRETTKFSEKKIFEKYYPEKSKIPQNGFFCNNANSAIDRKIWSEFKFNEEITGLEDMELAKRYFQKKGKIAYISNACVFHIHNESWRQTLRRYEREAIALKEIIPEINIRFTDMLRYIFISIMDDFKDSMKHKSLNKNLFEIFKFRIAQYIGSYKGNHKNSLLSERQKENYFYPSKKIED